MRYMQSTIVYAIVYTWCASTAAACLPIISQCGFVHSFARQHCADPSTEGLADQQRRRKTSEDDSKRDEQERAKNWNAPVRTTYVSGGGQKRTGREW